MSTGDPTVTYTVTTTDATYTQEAATTAGETAPNTIEHTSTLHQAELAQTLAQTHTPSDNPPASAVPTHTTPTPHEINIPRNHGQSSHGNQWDHDHVNNKERPPVHTNIDDEGDPGYSVLDDVPKGTKTGKNYRKKIYGGPNKDYSSEYKNRQFPYEYHIKRRILRGYDKNTRPVKNDSSTTTVFVAMSLYHILDTNEKFQTLSALISLRLRWNDEFLVWNPAEYGNVHTIWIPASLVWRPDIMISNFADDSFLDFQYTNAIVQYNGNVLWMFPAVVKTYCTMDVRHFPFDRQSCNIVFFSWTFNGFKLDVAYNSSVKNTVYYTPRNQEWYVDKVGAERHVKIYACCIEPYPDVTFTIHMTRRSLFYIINLIFPCLLIYAVSFLGFFLPVESGEKVNLEITILLALVVFLLIVGETLPPTPDGIPVLGMLFGTTMLMVSIALVMAVIVTNVYLRKESGTRVPYYIRRLLCRGVRRNSYCNKITATENHVCDGKMQEMIEIDSLSMQSEVEPLPCRSRCRRRSTNPHNGDLESNLRISYEWQILAKCVDRLFFWLFLVSSIGALIAMFAQIPSISAT